MRRPVAENTAFATAAAMQGVRAALDPNGETTRTLPGLMASGFASPVFGPWTNWLGSSSVSVSPDHTQAAVKSLIGL